MSTSAQLTTRRAHERAGWPARARVRVRVLVGAVFVLAVLVVAGWFLHSDLLVRLDADTTSMKLTTAAGLALVSGGLWSDRAPVRAVLFLGAMVLGLLVLGEYTLDRSLGIDELLVTDWTARPEQNPGRPAQTTAACLVLLAASGLLSDRGRTTLAQVAAGVPLVVGLVAVYGYLYETDAFYRVGPYATMAVHTGVAMVVLGFAALLSVPYGIVQWISFGKDTGATLQRMLVPVGVVMLPFAGWVELEGQRRDYYDAALGTALLLAFVAVVVSVVGYRVGRLSFGMDRERDQLLEELHRVNADLEDRVRSRSHQLNRQKTKLALSEERDRIARDLHDRVIQRIFAAGLQVASLGRTARKEAERHGDTESTVAENLDTVALELDLAIRELRNSIFELTSIDDHDNVEQVVRDIAARASRILGFMPRVDVSGQVAGIPSDLVAQLASVIQEGLSNVARHARASAVEVALLGTETHLQVRITDDGVGLPDPLPRSSGISNLMSRARGLGGTATWSNVAPSGTVLVWRIPRDGVPPVDGYRNETPVASSESDQSAPASAGS